MLAIETPFEFWTDRDGDPLDSGYIYFGVPNLNPETNPVQVFWDIDGTIPAAQPLRTSGGYIVRNGAPAAVYVESDHSITVRNRKREIVFYAPSSNIGEGRSVTSEGADPTGTRDSTAALAAALVQGGEWYVPEGDYLIAYAGPDAGGVSVVLKSSLRVRCHPSARFFTNGVDNDLIRIVAPTIGDALPAGGITVEWDGGIFDQSGQKNSTVVPFIPEYPLPNPGASATCDGLSIRGDCTIAGVPAIGISLVRVAGARFFAGDHWQTAGGDSALFVGGCGRAEVFFNTFKGSRDLGFYGSASDSGVGGPINCLYNSFEACFHGAAVKRSARDFILSCNQFDNCVRAVIVEHLIGAGSKQGDVSDNAMRRCGTVARIDLATAVTVTGNKAFDAGALLANGTAEPLIGLAGIVLRGSTQCDVLNNKFIGVSALATAAYPLSRPMLDTDTFDPGSGPVPSTKNNFVRNIGSGTWRNLAFDTGDRNSWIENECPGATTANVVVFGTNAFDIRVDPVTGMRQYIYPVGFSDGTVFEPSIVRRSQPSIGFFFGTSRVGVANGGNEVMAWSNRIHMLVAALGDFADDAAAAGGGVAVGTCYRTGSIIKVRVA